MINELKKILKLDKHRNKEHKKLSFLFESKPRVLYRCITKQEQLKGKREITPFLKLFIC